MKAFRRSWLRNVCKKNNTDIVSETFRSSRLFCGYQLQKEMIAWLNWKLLFPDILSVFMKVILRILKHRFENYKLNPIQDGSFRDCSWMHGVKKVPLPKICHTCPANLTQLYLIQRGFKNYMNNITHPFSSADISIFCHQHRKSTNFAISRNTDIHCILIHNF